MIGDNAIEYEYTPSEFDVDVTWEDVLDKLDDEYTKGMQDCISSTADSTIICLSQYIQAIVSLRKAAEEVYKEVPVKEMHVLCFWCWR